jgi:UDP-galactopyranose mutase
MDEHFDYIVVGSGLFGAVCARELTDSGRKVLVLEKKQEIGGALHTTDHNNIIIHDYGPHIFHTNDKEIWDYVNKYATFNNFINSPIAKYDNNIYSLPFNMHTFSKLFTTSVANTPEELEIILSDNIPQHIKDLNGKFSNLKEKAISMVGTKAYKYFIKYYTEKQWGKPCEELPPEIIDRIPVRYTYDNRYYDDRYQGVPIHGYTLMILKILEGIKVLLATDFLRNIDYWKSKADRIIYTGPIDEYFEYKYGVLNYRSLRFETEILDDCNNYQGNAVVNYTGLSEDYTRIIEHKWFNYGKDPDGYDISGTIITKEYPIPRTVGCDPYYPLRDEYNLILYKKYALLAKEENNVYFGGRLAEFKYYDMDDTILSAIKLAKELSFLL